MFESIVILYYSEFMVNYTNTGMSPSKAQGLALYYDRTQLKFHIIHAATGNINQPVISYSSHKHKDLFHLAVFTADSGSFSFKEREYQIQKGQILLVSPNEKHSFSTRNSICSYNEVTFSLLSSENDQAVCFLDFTDLLKTFSGGDVKDVDQLILLSESGRAEMSVYFNQLLQGLKQTGTVADLMWQQALSSILSYMYREHLMIEPMSGNIRAYPLLEQARLHIEINFDKKISAETLVNITGVSRGHFFRQFKHVYGITAIRYQMSLRINAAKNLIKGGDLPNKAIAERLGFSDVYHFSHVFKKETGLPPGEYRKQIEQ